MNPEIPANPESQIDPAAPLSPQAGSQLQVMGGVMMGGASSRFGSDKALALFHSKPMAGRVVEAIRGAGVDPVVAVGGTAGAELGLITIPDRAPGLGPLAALATILGYARVGGVLVAPCDHPLLAASDVQTLVEAWRAEPSIAAIASLDGESLVSLGCWPATAARAVQGAVSEGRRSFRTALGIVAWRGVEVGHRSVLDSDDPAELKRLENLD